MHTLHVHNRIYARSGLKYELTGVLAIVLVLIRRTVLNDCLEMCWYIWVLMVIWRSCRHVGCYDEEDVVWGGVISVIYYLNNKSCG